MDNGQKNIYTRQTALEKIRLWFFTMLRTGLIGYFFTGYDRENNRFSKIFSKKKNRIKANKKKNVRKNITKAMESSIFAKVFPHVSDFLLRISTRDYGIMFFTMGVITSVLYPLRNYTTVIDVSLLTFVYGIIIAVCSLPLLVSKKSLSEDILKSRLVRMILIDYLGVRSETIRISSEKKKISSSNFALLAGSILAVISYFISPENTVKIILSLVFIYEIFSVPEMGIVTLLLVMPFMSTQYLAIMAIVVFISFAEKVLVGKRVFRFEYFDLWIIILLVLSLVGSFNFNYAEHSVQSMLYQVSFIVFYFVVANLIRSKEWYGRCFTSVNISLLLVSCIGLLQFVAGKLSPIFGVLSYFSTDNQRVSSVFSSPEMLGAFLVLSIPFAISYTLIKRKEVKSFGGFILTVISVSILVLTCTGSAVLGVLCAFVLLLIVYKPKYIYFAAILIIAIPALFFSLPDKVVEKVLAFLNISSADIDAKATLFYRVSKLIKENPFGIGCGNDIFRDYFSNAYGIDNITNAGNLYFQVAVEFGLLFLVLFLALIIVYKKVFYTYLTEFESRSDKVLFSASYVAINGFLIMGLFDHVWEDKRIMMVLFALIGLTVAFVRIYRDNLKPKSSHVDIAAADTDIILDNDFENKDRLKKRKYVHAPYVRKDKSAKSMEDTIKEFADENTYIRIMKENEENEADGNE